jgi:phosphoserine phosphatase
MKIRLTSLSTLLFPMLLLVGCSSSPTPSSPSASSPVPSTPSAAQVDLGADPLPSWKKGPAKQAIISFVKTTTDKANPQFVQPEDRIATFDQDGTTWVEQPMYSQLLFMRDRLVALAPQHPEWSKRPLFRGLIIGDIGAFAKATDKDLQDISDATQVSMPVDEFASMVKSWMATAKHPRFDRPYPQMVYQPMLEVSKYLRDNGYRTYIVTGGGQEFVRTYSQPVYGVPQDQVIGSVLETQYTYDKQGQPVLIRKKDLLLNDNGVGKAKDIYLFLGQHPKAAFGNSTGDQQMLEYTQAGGGASLEMLVLHDDAQREYAYGPAQGLPDTKVGKFTQALYDEAKAKGWTVISMKNDWKRIFAWENSVEPTH